MSEIQILKCEDLFPQDPMGESLTLPNTFPIKAWTSPEYSLILGASQKPEKELNLDHVVGDQIPIYRRRGGGGTVLLGPRGLCYALRFKKQSKYGIHDYLSKGTGLLQGLLESNFDLSTHQRGTSDLCIEQKKILGCSLYMPRDYVLYLASVLYQDETERISKYLAHPSREPEYRAGRLHKDFVTSLETHIDDMPDQNWFCQALIERAMATLSEDLDF